MRLTPVPPPTVADKTRRAVWQAVRLVLFRPTPPPMHAWRCALLRAFGARIGSKVRVYPSASIWAPWNLVMAARSCLGPGVDCYNVATVAIDEGATVSQRAFLCSASRDYADPAFGLVVGPIRIGRRAWVAAEAYVGPGTAIGAAAVVAARAVVTHDVPEGALVAGNPARMLSSRTRHEEPTAAAAGCLAR